MVHFTLCQINENLALVQGYSNVRPLSESRPLDGNGWTSPPSQRCILHPEVFIPKFCAFGCSPTVWLSIMLFFS